MKKTVYLLILFGFGISFTFSCNQAKEPNNERIPSSEKKDTSLTTGIKTNGKIYRMRILANPDIIEPKKEVIFSFTPQIVGRESEPVPLDAEHGFEMHLIIVSNDLSTFDHRHPRLSDLGTYEQPYTFPIGGVYNLFAEYKPTGSVDTFQSKSIAVNGNSLKNVIYSTARLTSPAGPYEITLAPEESIKFESNKPVMISASITNKGNPVDPKMLGDYLGSKGHMVIIGLHNKAFLHVHPAVENGRLMFHTVFPQPGLYRAWIQIQNDNIVQTGDFVIQVDQGSDTSMGTKDDQMHADQH